MLPSGEAFLLRGRDYAPILHQACGRVVVERRDAKDPRRQRSEQGVDERGDGARLRKDQQQAEQHEHDHDRHQPVLLFFAKKLPPELIAKLPPKTPEISTYLIKVLIDNEVYDTVQVE